MRLADLQVGSELGGVYRSERLIPVEWRRSRPVLRLPPLGPLRHIHDGQTAFLPHPVVRSGGSPSSRCWRASTSASPPYDPTSPSTMTLHGYGSASPTYDTETSRRNRAHSCSNNASIT